MANDESTDTAFEREDKQVSDGNANCQRDSDVLMINHLRESLAKENADAEKWSCECQRLEKELNEAKAACAESAVEIKRLRREVVDRIVKCERLTKERDEAKAACADELHENLELFALLGLNSNEDFGNDTSTKALRKRIEALIVECDEARAAVAEIGSVLTEIQSQERWSYTVTPGVLLREKDGPWVIVDHTKINHALSAGAGKGWLSPDKRQEVKRFLEWLVKPVGENAATTILAAGFLHAQRGAKEALKLLEAE